MKRRQFVQAVSALTATQIFPHFAIGKPGQSANSKLNVAFIGTGGRGGTHVNFFEKTENIVAFCDVDQERAGGNYKKAPEAKRFEDFREMFDKMGNEIDAVCISTPDHTHFVATYTAMALGKHVMTEKPLTHDIWQARTLQKAGHYFKVVTQMGNQGHATDEIRQVKEWYESGITGNVHTVLSSFGGPNFGPDKYFNKPENYPPQKQEVPKHVNWELWRGPVAKDIAYNDIYIPKQWRGFFDFGNGQLGDWACHTLDAPFWALELGSPESVTVLEREISGEDFVPDRSLILYRFPARGDRGPVDLYWGDGGLKGPVYPEWNLNGDIGSMCMVGEKAAIRTGNRPNHDPRLVNDDQWEEFQKNLPKETYPRVKGNHQQEWVDAIKGDGPTPGSNFDYASGLTEMTILGVIAQRTGKNIQWDAENMRITNHPELDIYVKEPVRKGWECGEEVWS